MKNLFIIISVLLMMASCDKDDRKVMVDYRLTDANSELKIEYRNQEKILVSQNVDFESWDDWKYTFEANPGDILFLSALSYDTDSLARLQILVDGKIYKEHVSIDEPGKYIIVSGTVSY